MKSRVISSLLHLSLLPFTLLPSLARAAILPRQAPTDPNANKCCFTLSAVGTLQGSVRENTIGELLLGGPFRQGFFCLDTTVGTIQDGVGNNCFVRAPAMQFQCFQGVPFNSNVFAFGSVPPVATAPGVVADTNVYLTLDGEDVFLACPGPRADGSYNIFGTTKTEKTGCLEVRLVQMQPAGVCAASVKLPREKVVGRRAAEWEV